MRILVNTPKLSLAGGVANHYMGLKNYWNEDVRYNTVGKRSPTGRWLSPFILPFDLLKFVLILITWNPDVVLLNPSMTIRALKRDFVYLRVAKMFGIKVAVFFHGFHTIEVEPMKEKIANDLNKADLVFVLAGEFEKTLRDWGVVCPIELTTTKVDDKLIEDFDINRKTGDVKNFLYLARVTKPKGIFVSLDVFARISELGNKVKFTVVGGGEALSEAKEYAKQIGLYDVEFTGPLSGRDLIEQYTKADCYVFTSYYEGMPTSVLEAMAFGLPVITRPLGGLVDFFENGKMGFVVDSDKADDYVCAIRQVLSDPMKMKEISIYNHTYAKEYFMATSVAKSLEDRMKSIIL